MLLHSIIFLFKVDLLIFNSLHIFIVLNSDEFFSNKYLRSLNFKEFSINFDVNLSKLKCLSHFNKI